MVLKMNPEALLSPSKVKTDITAKEVKCKQYGGVMVLRKGSKGSFYGCSFRIVEIQKLYKKLYNM
jgi:restriction system protein